MNRYPISPTVALLTSCCLVTLLAGCKETAVYSQESFSADSPFKLQVTDPTDEACESARRALLGQGYLIDEAASDKVRGHKAYVGSGDRNSQIEMNVVCIRERRGSTLYATGVLSSYELKTSGTAASVGVSAVGSISLPIGRSADSLVKVGEQTITDPQFYKRFFAAVELTLGEMSDEADGEVAPAATAIPVETGPVVAAPLPVTPETTSPASAESTPATEAPASTAEPALPIPAAGPPPASEGGVVAEPEAAPVGAQEAKALGEDGATAPVQVPEPGPSGAATEPVDPTAGGAANTTVPATTEPDSAPAPAPVVERSYPADDPAGLFED